MLQIKAFDMLYALNNRIFFLNKKKHRFRIKYLNRILFISCRSTFMLDAVKQKEKKKIA